MKSKMQRPELLLVAVLVWGLVVTAIPPVRSHAQAGSPELATWEVELWPEYDRPSVLVILRGAFVDGTALPLAVGLDVPAGVDVNAVAYQDETGNLISVPWQAAASATGGQQITFDLEQTAFVVEYYADILTPPPARSFQLEQPVPYDAQGVALYLRQPSRASDMEITPAMESAGVDSLGNPQYSLSLGAMSAGDVIAVSASYTKPDAEPSVSTSVPPAGDIEASPSTGIPEWLPWAAGIVLGALLVAGGIIGFSGLRRSGDTSRQARRRRERDSGKAPKAKPAKAPGTSGQRAYCSQCGQKFQENDKFCRACGAPR
jgi:hypothetical protein